MHEELKERLLLLMHNSDRSGGHDYTASQISALTAGYNAGVNHTDEKCPWSSTDSLGWEWEFGYSLGKQMREGACEFKGWKLEDVRCGRLVCHPLNTDLKDESYRMGCFAKWSYKIGYHGGAESIVLVNLADGMTHRIMTPEDCLTWLRVNGMVPMRRDWYQALNDFMAKDVLMLA